MNIALSRARVGFLIFIGVVTFVLAAFLIGQKTQLFSRTFTVQANFSQAEGVKLGTFVVMSGYTVGAVSDIELTRNADSVRLVLRISERVRPFIKSDSKAEIKQEGLVGNKIINLLIGSASLPPIRDDGYVQGTPPFALTGLADNITAITDTTKIVSGQIKTLLMRLNNGEGLLGRLLTEDAIYTHLLSISAKADSGLGIATTQLAKLSEILQRMGASVNTMIAHSDSTVGTISTTAKEVDLLVRNLNGGRGTAGALLTDRRLYDSLLTLIGALTDVSYDAGNAAYQAAEGLYGLRTHWLLGRIFGGDDIDSARPPTPAYRKLMRDLHRKASELDRRENAIIEKEKQLGITPERNAPAP